MLSLIEGTMQYKPQFALGFEINDEIANQLDLTEEYSEWKSDPGCSFFTNTFVEKYNPPENIDVQIQKFVYEGKGGEVVSLEGFEWGKTYCYFRDVQIKDKGWRPYIKKLTKKAPNITFNEASWSEFL